MKEPRKITHIGRKWVRIEREDWLEFLALIKPLGSYSREEDCDAFCGAACANHNGCDFSFGDPPGCGAACVDGEVFLQ